MRARIVWLPLLLTAACGSRSELDSSASSGPGAPSSSSTSSSSGADGAGCSATPPLPVTSAVASTPSFLSQTFLDSVAVDGANVLIATSLRVNGGPDLDPTWRVRLFSGDLSSMGPSQIVLTHAANALVSSGYVAVGFGHRGFVAWDFNQGSRFVPLAADGSPSGPPVLLGPDVCSSLVAMPGGFVALQSMGLYLHPHSLVALDPSGVVLAVTPLSGGAADPHASPAPGPGLLSFDDHSLLVAWEGNSPFSIMAQHLDASGAPLAKPARLFDLSAETAGNDQFAMTSLGTSALVAWGNDASSHRAAARADEDGHIGPETVFGSGLFETLGVGAGAAGAFVSWAEVPDGSAVGELVAQRMTPEGVPTGSPFPIAPGLLAAAPILASTPAGEVVAFTGFAPDEPQQAYVTRLSCGP